MRGAYYAYSFCEVRSLATFLCDTFKAFCGQAEFIATPQFRVDWKYGQMLWQSIREIRLSSPHPCSDSFSLICGSAGGAGTFAVIANVLQAGLLQHLCDALAAGCDVLGGLVLAAIGLVQVADGALEENPLIPGQADVIPVAAAVLPGGIEVEQAVGEFLAGLLDVGQHALCPVAGIGLQVKAGQALRQHVEP